MSVQKAVSFSLDDCTEFQPGCLVWVLSDLTDWFEFWHALLVEFWNGWLVCVLAWLTGFISELSDWSEFWFGWFIWVLAWGTALSSGMADCFEFWPEWSLWFPAWVVAPSSFLPDKLLWVLGWPTGLSSGLADNSIFLMVWGQYLLHSMWRWVWTPHVCYQLSLDGSLGTLGLLLLPVSVVNGLLESKHPRWLPRAAIQWWFCLHACVAGGSITEQ